jgi:hypothetical protein
MPMIGVEFEFAAARRTGHSKEGGASGIERFSCAKESIVRPRHGHQKTPSFASIALPMATRLGASVAAGMSMFNAKADRRSRWDAARCCQGAVSLEPGNARDLRDILERRFHSALFLACDARLLQIELALDASACLVGNFALSQQLVDVFTLGGNQLRPEVGGCGSSFDPI